MVSSTNEGMMQKHKSEKDSEKASDSSDVKTKVDVADQLGSTVAVWTKSRKLCTLLDAWKNGNSVKIDSHYVGSRRRREYGFLYSILDCKVCCHYGSHIIPVGDEAYMSDIKKTKRWWDSDFISGFAALVAHEAHLEAHTQPRPSTQLVHCH